MPDTVVGSLLMGPVSELLQVLQRHFVGNRLQAVTVYVEGGSCSNIVEHTFLRCPSYWGVLLNPLNPSVR